MMVILANPRGFCAGVDRAIEIVERAVAIFGMPVYVRHEVVHNKYVVAQLRDKGVVFVKELDEIPDEAVVIFSAHGVAPQVRHDAEKRRLRVLDATCPLVTKVHLEVIQYARQRREVILIGHAGHPEVLGTMGQYYDHIATEEGRMRLVESIDDAQTLQVKEPQQLALVTQTTLSVDDTREIIAVLQARFPQMVVPRKKDICYATQNRQDAVKKLTETCDLILIVGSPNSSNSNRLREIAAREKIESYLIENAKAISPAWLKGKRCIGVSAGASAPETLLLQVVDTLKEQGADDIIEQEGTIEDVTFSLPRVLRAVL